MWSPFYYYLQIRSDSTYSRSINTRQLVSFLSENLGLVQEGHNSFRGHDQLPWMTIELTFANADGSFSSQGVHHDHINLIDIVGTKDERGKIKSECINLAVEIAKWLQWDLIEEQDDDSNENIIIWNPKIGNGGI